MAIRSVKDFVQAANTFRNDGKSIADKLDDLVVESIQCTWKHGDITPVNTMIQACGVIKGLNRRALVTYYRDVVPFFYDVKQEQFGKADKNKVLKMQGTLGSGADDACGPFVLEYITSNVWHSLNKEHAAKPYAFNLDRIVSGINAQLGKALSNDKLSITALETLSARVAALANEYSTKLLTERKAEVIPTTAIAEALRKAG